MLCGNFFSNSKAIQDCLQTGVQQDMHPESYYVKYDKVRKIVYLWLKSAAKSGSDRLAAMYKIDNYEDYTAVTYYFQGVIDGFEDKDLPF